MRPMIFKGISNGSWVIGDLLSEDMDEKGMFYFIIDNLQRRFLVDRDSICQSIGAYDSNRKVIFENDILHNEVDNKNYSIAWDSKDVCFIAIGYNTTKVFKPNAEDYSKMTIISTVYNILNDGISD